MKNYDWFNEIRENNIAALRSVQKAEWNVLESFGDLNIEPLHFIFELLQNADDQKAKKAKFIFSDTQIQFFHNGTTFKKKDVKGICGYAVKIKTQDNQKIGKFGLGFKSVYQFTDVPKIFTEVEGEPLNFLIENECVPDLIELTDNEILNELNQFGKTGFLFNLKTDIQDRLEEQLQTFIEKYSQKILMYLQHIKKIEIISKNSNIVISKKRIGDQIIEILYLKNSKKIIQRNFVFSYEIEEILKKYGDNIPPIKISFKMKNENFVKDQETSKLNVFLPTMEETGFYFDIHAPFKLDAGRAHLSKSQKNISFNQALMYEVCNAITKSILELKRLSLINSSFIELLPIEDDPQPENFVDVRESIDKCLREENIWPILQKGYSSIKKVIQASKISKEIFEIKNLKQIFNFTKNYRFSDLDLDHLYSNIDELSWLIDLNFRGLKLAKRLGVSNFEDFKSDILRGYFRNIGNISILTSKKNEWLTKFYLWIDDNFSDYEFQSWHIIKTNTKVVTKDEGKKIGLYFTSGENIRFISKTKTEYSNFYLLNTYFNSLKNRKLKKFFEKCGVKEINKQDYILDILKKYFHKKNLNKKLTISIKEYVILIAQIIKFYNKTNNKQFFNNYLLLLDSNKKFRKIEDLYLDDEKFYRTYLSDFYSDKVKLFIPPKFEKKLIPFSIKLGIKNRLPIIHQRFIPYYRNIDEDSSHPNVREALKEQGGYYNFNADYDNDDYKFDIDCFSKLTLNKSFAICLTLNKIQKYFFNAVYKRVQKAKPSVFPSTLRINLTEKEWIPDVNGNFKKPSDLNANSIDKEFYKNASQSWLELIDFEKGQTIKKSINELSKKSGIKKEIINRISRLYLNDQEKLLEKLEEFEQDLTNENQSNLLNESTPKHGSPNISSTVEMPVRENIFEKTEDINTNKKNYKNKKKIKERSNLHNEDVKKLYAYHCQVCLAKEKLNKLIPSKSYAEYSYHRKHLIEAHHIIHHEDGGIADAGNLISLCRYHHREYGDKIESNSITSALKNSLENFNVFPDPEPAGILVKIKIKDTNNYLKIYFDNLHKDYWLNNK